MSWTTIRFLCVSKVFVVVSERPLTSGTPIKLSALLKHPVFPFLINQSIILDFIIRLSAPRLTFPHNSASKRLKWRQKTKKSRRDLVQSIQLPCCFIYPQTIFHFHSRLRPTVHRQCHWRNRTSKNTTFNFGFVKNHWNVLRWMANLVFVHCVFWHRLFESGRPNKMIDSESVDVCIVACLCHSNGTERYNPTEIQFNYCFGN